MHACNITDYKHNNINKLKPSTIRARQRLKILRAQCKLNEIKTKDCIN